jgi:hypothetical protein
VIAIITSTVSRPLKAGYRRISTAIAFALLAASLVFGARAAWADRVILTPSGTTLAPLSATAEGIVSVSGRTVNDTWINGSVNIVEIEAAQLERPGRQASVVSLQASVLPETIITPSISAGVRDIFDTTRQFGNTGYTGRSLYVAAGKTLLSTELAPFPFRNASITAGIGTGVTNGFFGSASADLALGFRQTLEFDGRGLNYRLSHDIGGIARIEFERIHDQNFIGLHLSTPVHL